MLPVQVLPERRAEEGSAAFRAAGGREAKTGDLAFAGGADEDTANTGMTACGSGLQKCCSGDQLSMFSGWFSLDSHAIT